MKPKEAIEFDEYVKSGFYSDWYRDNAAKIGKEATRQKFKIIREYRVSQFPELEDTLIKLDGTIEDVDLDLINKIINIINGKFVRIMVSNHDVYIEFISAAKEYKFVGPHTQYDEYVDKYGNKLYHQMKTVNYADYVPGRWYVSLSQILKVINENPRRNNQ